MTGLEALKKLKYNFSTYTIEQFDNDKLLGLIEKNLKALETIEENLQFGYVFIGYDKDNKLWFQYADAELYEAIKKLKEGLL